MIIIHKIIIQKILHKILQWININFQLLVYNKIILQTMKQNNQIKNLWFKEYVYVWVFVFFLKHKIEIYYIHYYIHYYIKFWYKFLN